MSQPAAAGAAPLAASSPSTRGALSPRSISSLNAGPTLSVSSKKRLKYAWEAAPRGQLTVLSLTDDSTTACINNNSFHQGDTRASGGTRSSMTRPLARVNIPGLTDPKAADDALDQNGAGTSAGAGGGNSGGAGGETHERDPLIALESDETTEKKEEHQLDQFRATAIAGNDITSSILYSAGVNIQAGGVLAPVSTLFVSVLLYYMRFVYTEVCGAIPINGGTYNALLNTSTKAMAALAAVLSLLSYTATAVVSAASAASYLNYQVPDVSLLAGTLTILILFALLNLAGMSESANVASLLFVIHITTMFILIISSIVFVGRDGGSILVDNYRALSYSKYNDTDSGSSDTIVNVSTTTMTTTTTTTHTVLAGSTTTAATAAPMAAVSKMVLATFASPHSNVVGDIYYGFATALLGVTGFESSANYIEEQQPGVFPKTLRNMWALVVIINPSLVFLTLGVVPLPQIFSGANYALAQVARDTIGNGMKIFVIVEACMVLSGAVLTAYVGVGGLLVRMSLDGILPKIFLTQNSRGTYYVIIISFCILCCALRLLVGSDMTVLGGVYAIAFLTVMSLFCVSNFLLKQKRDSLNRDNIASPLSVGLCLAALIAGIIGNLVKSAADTLWFIVFFSIFASVVVVVMKRVQILKALSLLLEKKFPRVAQWCQQQVVEIRGQRIVYFSKTADISHLNKVVRYIEENEAGCAVYFVYCTEEYSTPDLDAKFEAACATLDIIYPRMTINCVHVCGRKFDPETVERVGKALSVQRNYMFIAAPRTQFFPQYNGLRVITHYTNVEEEMMSPNGIAEGFATTGASNRNIAYDGLHDTTAAGEPPAAPPPSSNDIDEERRYQK